MISIIIPIYNRAHLIEDTLHSIKQQTYTQWECIIIDDGSTDHTIDVISSVIVNDSRFKLYERPSYIAKGPSACRNYAVTLSTGLFIQFFDSDDIMHPDHLLLKHEAIGDKDFVVCGLATFKGTFNTDLFTSSTFLKIPKPKCILESFATGEFPMMMVAPMWKKSSLLPYLPIREDLHILEDHELHIRALQQQPTFEILQQDLIYYRVGETSSTNQFYNQISYGLESYFKAKTTVLSIISTHPVKLSILKMTLGFFRLALAERDLESAKACLKFIKDKDLCCTTLLKLKYYRIVFFFHIFKIIKRGDTLFKPLFKL